MSRSNPRIPNPATRWFEWDAGKGHVKYYDKEQEQDVKVSPPFNFLLLDELAKIGGWHQQKEKSIYSQEVGSTAREPLTVRCGNDVIAQGMYADIKETVKDAGGHYLASLYIAYKNDSGELVIGNLKLKGAALSSWMDFTNEIGKLRYEDAIQIDGFTTDSYEADDGVIEYHSPMFEMKDTKEETHQKALSLDEELQEYLDSKETSTPQEPDHNSEPDNSQPVSSSVDLNEDFDDIDDDLPFTWLLIIGTLGSQILGSGLI